MLLQSHHEQVYGLFFGLIGGVLWIFLRLLQSGIRSWINLFIGVAFGIATIRFIPMNTPDTAALFFPFRDTMCMCDAIAWNFWFLYITTVWQIF